MLAANDNAIDLSLYHQAVEIQAFFERFGFLPPSIERILNDSSL